MNNVMFDKLINLYEGGKIIKYIESLEKENKLLKEKLKPVEPIVKEQITMIIENKLSDIEKIYIKIDLLKSDLKAAKKISESENRDIFTYEMIGIRIKEIENLLRNFEQSMIAEKQNSESIQKLEKALDVACDLLAKHDELINEFVPHYEIYTKEKWKELCLINS